MGIFKAGRLFCTVVLIAFFVTLMGCASTGQLKAVDEKAQMALDKANAAMNAANNAQAAAEFEAENPISDDPALVDRVVRIGNALVPHSQRQNIPYSFKVVDTDEVNAFALPGGYIYVTRGMVEFVEEDHELAGVIGHEIAHVALRHSARLIENLAAAQAAIDLVTTSSEELERIYQDNATQLAINAVTQIVVNGWGRENELDADQYGTIYMARASYDPFEIIDLFERMGEQEDSPSDPLALMFATHPPFPDRIARVRETIREYRLG